MDTLRLECLLNLAQSKLRTRQYDEVIDNCTQAVISDPSSVKALYRRAQAHRAKDNFTEAAADIRAAIAIAPSDR